jgi:glycosyltransferase involved in cell wall biosynthesis
VCHLAYTFYETDNRVVRYARALAARGDEVDVVALRRPGQPRTEACQGVNVIRIQRRAKTEEKPGTYLVKIVWFLIRSFAVLSARQLRRRYDVVHVHNVPDFLVFAALTPKLMGAKVILDIHDILPELYAGKFGAPSGSAVFRYLVLAERLSCSFADYVIVANHLWHARLVERSTETNKCGTIMNYPDLRIFTPRGPDPSDAFIVLYPGSLSRHQGVDVAIRAFATASTRIPNAEFHIYGEGPARDDLRHLALELGVEQRVKFRDPLPVEQIAAVMASSHVGVEPKLASGFSNEAVSTKILEFMAAGVPAIVSRTLAHSHYFDAGVVRFFGPGDDRELAVALVEAYDQRPATARIERARAFAARFDWQQRVADYYHVVDLLAGDVCRHDRAGAVA